MAKNKNVVDIKPSNSNILTDFGTEQLFTVVIDPLTPYGGLLLTLTQPTGGTVISPITS